MYTLHIGNKNYSSWSLRPWILLTELGIPFEEKVHAFGPGFKVKSAGHSPSGKVPALHDGRRIVWDSLAIAEYLAERHAGVWPSNEDARAWARCAAAEMHSGFQALRGTCGMNCGIRVKLHSVSEAVRADLARVAELWSEGLSRFGGPFLAGPAFGAVDAFFCPVAFRVQSYGLELPPAAADCARRLLALRGMQRWYADALAEPWRDDAHEVEIAAAGKVLQDLRGAAAAS
ncbi:MAG TPA: glutathione S-transferase family protein [Usitatibacter sp.]|nr:glutathione S-transferase family protein [Usitatibacter sp.]